MLSPEPSGAGPCSAPETGLKTCSFHETPQGFLLFYGPVKGLDFFILYPILASIPDFVGLFQTERSDEGHATSPAAHLRLRKLLRHHQRGRRRRTDGHPGLVTGALDIFFNVIDGSTNDALGGSFGAGHRFRGDVFQFGDTVAD